MSAFVSDALIRLIRTRGLLLVLLIGLIIRLGFFISIQPWKEEVVNNLIIVSDAIGYDQLARSILSDFSFEGEFADYRTPGYPLFLAVLYSISSGSIWFVLLVQILINLLSIYITYKIGTLVFSEKVGLIAAFLFAIDIHQALFTVTLLTDPLFICLFLTSVYCLCKSLKDDNLKLFCLGALVMGLATLVRPISFLIPSVIVFFVVVFTRFEGKRRIIYSLAYVSIFVLTLSPWLLRNYVKNGEAQLSSISGYNLFYWNAAYVEAYKSGKPFTQINTEFDSIAVLQGVDLSDRFSFKNAEILSGMGKDYIGDNFLLYWRRHLMGMVNMYVGMGTKQLASALHIRSNPDHIEPYAEKNVIGLMIKFFKIKSSGEITLAVYLILFLLFNYLLAVYGIYQTVKAREIYAFLFVLIIIYFSFLTGIIGWVRYRLPVMPLIYILCAVGLVYLYDRKRKPALGQTHF